ALFEARIGGRDHRAGEVDAADGGRTPQDPALAGRGERVLVVHARVGDTHGNVARVELIERRIDEFRADLLLRRLGKPVGLEALHGSPLFRLDARLLYDLRPFGRLGRDLRAEVAWTHAQRFRAFELEALLHFRRLDDGCNFLLQLFEHGARRADWRHD